MNDTPTIDVSTIETMLAQLRDLGLQTEFLFKPHDRAAQGMRGIDFYSYHDFLRALVIGAQFFKNSVGVLPDIVQPRSFNEHIFFRKYFAFHRLPSLSNKIYAKNCLGRALGKALIAEVPWTGKDIRSLWQAAIAPGKYYLKANHASGFNLALTIPDDLAKRRAEIETTADRWMSSRYNFLGGEWQYSTFAPELLLEKHVDFEAGSVPGEYNFFCFGGVVRLISFYRKIPTRPEWAIYRPSWESYDATLDGYRLPLAPVPRPDNLAEMTALAAKIARDIDFVRVDIFSNGRDRMIVGELTFTPFDGRAIFSDPSLDHRFGRFFDAMNGDNDA